MGILGRLLGRGRRDEGADTLSPDQYFAGADAWRGVSSSNVHSVAYYGQGASGILGVRFLKKGTSLAGSEYRYQGVPYEVYASMLDANSKGRFVWSDLRGRYAYRKVW